MDKLDESWGIATEEQVPMDFRKKLEQNVPLNIEVGYKWGVAHAYTPEQRASVGSPADIQTPQKKARQFHWGIGLTYETKDDKFFTENQCECVIFVKKAM